MQILGKKGHTLSWLTGISNPYIRVSLIGTNTDCEAGPSLSSKILNLPSNASCKLEGVGDENLKDCLLKFVVLDFDRFSRSEFVAEVLVTLGDLEDLNEGVIICEELKLQQKVTVRKGKECKSILQLYLYMDVRSKDACLRKAQIAASLLTS